MWNSMFASVFGCAAFIFGYALLWVREEKDREYLRFINVYNYIHTDS